jgi:antitoxin FitA
LETGLASITIRNIDDEVKQALRIRAARFGRSMEEEVRLVLARSVGEAPAAVPVRTMADVMAKVGKLVDEAGGFDIVIEKNPPADFGEYERMHATRQAGHKKKTA